MERDLPWFFICYSKGESFGVPLILEFGGYIFTSVVGLSIGISLFTSLLSWTPPTLNIPWFYVGVSFIAIFLGAAVETMSIKALSQKIDLEDIDAQKKEFIKNLNEE